MMKKLMFLLATLLPLTAAWADDSGSCGENVTYTYVEATNTLTISGSGPMEDVSLYTKVIWRVNGYYDKIKTVIIEDGVTHIGEDAFWGCSAITSVTIPNSVTSIGPGAFSDCKSLTSITIPESVTSIGRSALSSTGLTSVTIPSGVTTIEERTFQYCEHLTSIDIPASVTSIGFLAFANCPSLTSITIPNTVTDTDRSILLHSGVKHPVYNNTLFVYLPTSYEGAYHIPEGIVKICGGAFEGCSSLTSVTIPESVTKIGDYAFSSCTSLTAITIPKNVVSIGIGAWGSPNLTSIVIHCQTIGGWSRIISLKEVTIGNGVTTIAAGAFEDCADLTSISIPASVSSISGEAFVNCNGLTSVTVAKDNPTYDSRDGCNAIIETATNTFIKGFACSSIPNGVTSIGESAFEECTGLTSITIPNGVTSIGESAFEECTGLTSVTIPNGVTSIGKSAFEECTGLTSITIPASVTSIGTMAFWRCNNLISVTAEMTNPCSITSSTFPDQLKSVGVLYVPAGRKSLYIYQGWDRCFANIEEMDEKPLWLSIVDAEQGTTKLQCKFGGIYTLCFEPADGWQIHSVTWQGQDVTAQLTADGVFTTPAISADAELNVTYQKGINGIKSTAQTSPFRVNAHRGILSISGISPGTPIAVYDLGGRLITTAKSADGITTLNMPTSESVVIVKAGEQSVKVAR